MILLTHAALAVVLGGSLGAGGILIIARLPRWGAPRLIDRIAPYVRDTADPLGLTPLVGMPADVSAVVRSVRDRVVGVIGGSAIVSRRLRQANATVDAATFRGRQLAWALVGLVAGALVVIALAIAGRAWAGSVLFPPIAGVLGAVLYDVHLSHAARTRMARIDEELPTVLEFLSLCVAAGEGILAALRRVGEVGAGELTAEIRSVVFAVGTGTALPDALGALSRELAVPALSRSIDHLIAALDRGAPLAQVLQAQAVDAREEAKRHLIEQAGRKEILMLLPLVFLILPLSVAFAIFPGIVMLRVGIG